ncbi:MAG: LPS assembly lipoprotein LptE [Alphaproteobacteria bacterium]
MGIKQYLSQVYILPIEGRIGQIITNNLKDRINTYGIPYNPVYKLSVKIEEPIIKSQTSLSNKASREALLYKAEYQLFKGDEIVLQDKSSAQTSYSILTKPYGTVVSKNDAIERAAAIFSDDIALRLSVYFEHLSQKQNNDF